MFRQFLPEQYSERVGCLAVAQDKQRQDKTKRLGQRMRTGIFIDCATLKPILLSFFLSGSKDSQSAFERHKAATISLHPKFLMNNAII